MINLKKFSTVLMSAGVLLGVLAAPVVGHADTKNSTATVNVTPSPTGDGTLSLDQVPNFTFGAGITTAGKTLNGTANQDLIVDDETGTASGWTVTANLGSFSVAGSNDTTTNAFPSSYMAVKTPNASPAGTKVGDAPDSSDATATLNVDGAADNIITAKSGQGVGKWDMAFSDIALHVLSVPMAKASYNANITWTLTSGPTSSTTDAASK
ncbi:MAG TPA: hypothetical protein DDW71_03940 [Lactobacillus sp.]|nr:hypothetical protein [Lactobacillus sp.]